MLMGAGWVTRVMSAVIHNLHGGRRLSIQPDEMEDEYQAICNNEMNLGANALSIIYERLQLESKTSGPDQYTRLLSDITCNEQLQTLKAQGHLFTLLLCFYPFVLLFELLYLGSRLMPSLMCSSNSTPISMWRLELLAFSVINTTCTATQETGCAWLKAKLFKFVFHSHNRNLFSQAKKRGGRWSLGQLLEDSTLFFFSSSSVRCCFRVCVYRHGETAVWQPGGWVRENRSATPSTCTSLFHNEAVLSGDHLSSAPVWKPNIGRRLKNVPGA